MLIYLLIGALLAQRFKVLVLVPAIALGALVAVSLGRHYGASAWQIVGAAVVDIVCLQLGYLAGAGANHLVTGILSRSHRRAIDESVSHWPAAR